MIYLKKTPKGWVPACEESQKMFDNTKNDEVSQFERKRKRSSRSNRTFHAFLKVVLDNQETYKNEEDLLTYLCMKVGHGDWKPLKLPNSDEIVSVFTRRSISFREADQDAFQTLSQAVYDAIRAEYGLDIGEWLKSSSEGLCAFPDCQSRAVHKHHIFPGTARRQLSDRAGLVVDTCLEHHNRSHEQGHIEEMQKIWCEVIGIDYYDALHLVS